MPKAFVLGGGTGLLGKALVRTLQQRGWKTATLGREDGDILDQDFLRLRIDQFAPDWVFNTIAWTQVDDAEDHEEEALAINRSLPASLARLVAASPGRRLMHYSTDFVFSGPQSAPWTETDAVAPINVYGSSKLAGENAILTSLPDRSCILRTAWLFGPDRKNFVSTIINACRQRDILNVVDDQVGSPTYTPDLALWSAQLAEKNATGLWHAVNSGHASWCELAIEAIHLASAPCRIAPISSDQWPQKAKRPASSILDNNKLASFLGHKPRPWPQALRDYIYASFAATQEK